MSATFLPQPRLDTLATDAASGRTVRRTEYSGILWVDGPVDFHRSVMLSHVPRRKPRITRAILPDSLVYLASTATVVVHTWALGPGDQLYIFSSEAELTPAPSNAEHFAVGFTLAHAGSVPASFGYRIIVETDPAHLGQ